MIETLFAWVMLIAALINGDTDYYIAAAIFAVAAQISRVCDRMDKGRQ